MTLYFSKNFTTQIFFLLNLAVAIAFANGSTADEVDSFDDSVSRKITKLSKSGKCLDAWKIIWPHVMHGSDRAAAQLFGEISFGNIWPPLYAPPNIEELRSDVNNKSVKSLEVNQFIADLIFSVRPEKMRFRDVVPNRDVESLIAAKESVLSVIWNKHVFAKYKASQCLSPHSKETCYNPNLWTGMVKSLSAWNHEFITNEKLNITARCRRK